MGRCILQTFVKQRDFTKTFEDFLSFCGLESYFLLNLVYKLMECNEGNFKRDLTARRACEAGSARLEVEEIQSARVQVRAVVVACWNVSQSK